MNGNFTAGKMAMYMLAQVLGGICAGITYLSMYGAATNLQPNEAYKWHCAGAVEFLYTFMLVFVVLRAAVADVNPDSKEYFPLAIGVVVASAWEGVYYCGVYTLFEFAGAAAAAM